MSKFTYDCSECAAFCCIALGFEKGADFAHEKPKNERCHNLNDCDQCKIHSQLEEKGYHGCIDFNCYGSGPHILKLYNNVDWKNNRDLELEIYNKFYFLKNVFQVAAATEQALSNKGINPKALTKQFFSLVATRQKIPDVSDKEACDKFTNRWENHLTKFLRKNR